MSTPGKLRTPAASRSSGTKPRVALVLTGGSARGAFIAGVIRSLVVEHGLDPAVVAGVSIGAINAAHLAVAPLGDAEALQRAAIGLAQWWRDQVPRPMWRLLTRRARIAAVRASLQGLDLDALRRSGRHWFGGATDAISGRWVCASSTTLHDHSMLEGIVAFPGLLPPVPVGAERWMDGVLRRVVPMHEVLKTGVEEVVVISGGCPRIEPWSGDGALARSIRIAVHELTFLKDVRTALEEPGLRVRIFTPDEPLPSPWRFDRAAVHASLAHGLEVGAAQRECDPELFLRS